MGEARAAGLGFYGYCFAETLALNVLEHLATIPLEALQEPQFPHSLGITHALFLATQAIHLAPDAQLGIHSGSREARNFALWTASTGLTRR
jgi:hypothetical protein